MGIWGYVDMGRAGPGREEEGPTMTLALKPLLSSSQPKKPPAAEPKKVVAVPPPRQTTPPQASTETTARPIRHDFMNPLFSAGGTYLSSERRLYDDIVTLSYSAWRIKKRDPFGAASDRCSTISRQ